MSEEQILNGMNPEELASYMDLIEECTIIIEKEYKKERDAFNNKQKPLYD